MTRTSLASLLLLGIPLLAGPGCSGGRSADNRITPEEIRGAWRTDAPGYADRGMEILEKALAFDVGGGDFTVQVIRSIETSPAPEGTDYEIEYRNREGGIFTLSFTYRPADTTIVFRNQPELIWVRNPRPGG